MEGRTREVLLTVLAVVLAMAGATQGQITIPTVTIVDPNNSWDDTGFGTVDYAYEIGKYEVSNAEYAAFLNAVAASDPCLLYSSSQDITRSGSDGSYTYAAIGGTEDHPVSHVNQWDALRFCNWLTNGQGSGGTESGTYAVNGADPGTLLDPGLTRAGGVVWALPTQNEWYKAAFYDGAVYYDYPCGSDTQITGDDTWNDTGNTGNLSGGPWETTAGGAYSLSESPYGTYDQGGNVREFTEDVDGGRRWIVGGGWTEADYTRAGTGNFLHYIDSMEWETGNLGFRVVGIGISADSDGDGVIDTIDLCPNTPGATPVNANGCPDTDGDGVYDDEDLCDDPCTWVDVNGCPDRDLDGVADANDSCPDTDPNVPFGATDSAGCSMVLTYSHFVYSVASNNYSIATDSNGDVLVASSGSGDPEPIPINKYKRLTFANLATFDVNAPKSPGAGGVSPYGLDVDSQGNIVVFMSGGSTYTLSTLSATGVPVRQLDLSVEPNCHFDDIAVDLDDNVWGIGRQVELVGGEPTWVNHIDLLDKDTGSVIMRVDNDDLAPAGLSWEERHRSVTVDENGLVYVSDYYRIIRFDPCDVGNTAVVIAGNPDNSAGTGPGEFTGPIKGIAVVGGRLYAADAPHDDPNSRVQIFNASTGAFIQELTDAGLDFMHGLDVDSNGNIYVSNAGTNRAVHLWATPFCGDPGHQYPGADITEDCYVNEDDLLGLDQQWLQCTHPADAGCQDLVQATVRYMPHWPDANAPIIDGDLDEAAWTTADPCWWDLPMVYAGDPCDIVSAKFAVYWGGDATDPCQLIFLAVKVDDRDHVLIPATNWNTSDRIEIYVQGDPNGGDQWGSESRNKWFDKAQQYSVGEKGPGFFGADWGVFGNGLTIPGLGNVGDAGFKYNVKVKNTTELHYEIQAKAWVWYGGRYGGASKARRLEPGMRVGFDVIADSRYGSLEPNNPSYDGDFGMLSANLDTQKYIYAERFQAWELLDFDGTKAPGLCGNWGYLEADINAVPDCYIDLQDYMQLALQWLDCTDPDPPCSY